MVTLIFAANAVMALFALALCFWHAWGDRDAMVFLSAGVGYGVLLEQLVILHFARYHYHAEDYLLTVADVPLVIGFGWAAIIYAGFMTARQIIESQRVVPLFVALFALHIDLAIDAVAIRIPFWSWTPPGMWFGVPLGNFMGWFLVASLFPASWLVLTERISNRPLRGILTTAGAVAGLIVLLEVWTVLTTTPIRKIIVFGSVVGISLWAVARYVSVSGPIDPRITAVPVLYHGFYIAALLGFGMYQETPAILVVSLVMLAITAGLHYLGNTSTRKVHGPFEA